MSIPYAETGRTRQKGRTRDAMLAALRELLAEGTSPTVEQVADRAGISRTTAYRYFANQRELLVACYPQFQMTSVLGADAPTDPIERLDRVTKRMGEELLAHEPELRAMLRLSLEMGEYRPLPLRSGGALPWIEDALSPLRSRMSKAALRKLVLAIRAALGIEPLVWLTGVGGLSRPAAVELMRSTARTLLAAALAG